MIVTALEHTTPKRNATRTREVRPVRWGDRLWVAHVLRHHRMPAMNIGRVLMTEDAEIIRRHMELHRERLEERLADERAITERIEMLLVEAIRRRKRPHGGGAVDRSDARSPIRDGT